MWKTYDFLEVLANQHYRYSITDTGANPQGSMNPISSQAYFHQAAYGEVSQGMKLLAVHYSMATDQQSINSSASTGNSWPEKAAEVVGNLVVKS